MNETFLKILLPMLIGIGAGFPQSAEEPIPNDDQRFTALTDPPATDDGAYPSSAQLAKIYSERFRKLWNDDDFASALEKASDNQVLLRLRAANRTAFHAPETWVLKRFESALAEAHRRSLAGRDHVVDLYDAFMAASLYERARETRQRYPNAELPRVPEIIDLPDRALDASQRIVWMAHADPYELQAEIIESDQPGMVVVSSPNCGFCRKAIRELSQDPVLGPVVRAHALWLVKKSPADSFHDIARWNAEHAETPMIYADHVDDWPMIEFGSTPRFYFLRGGNVQAQFFGWLGGEEAMWKIAGGFDSIGLLDAEELADDSFVRSAAQSERKPCPTYAQAWQEIQDATPVRTREQLDKHLAQASDTSPIRKLSAEAEKRLIASLKFGPNRIRAFRLDDLRAQLSPEEQLEVTRLFGFQYLYANFLFPADLLNREEQDRRNRLNCTDEYSRDEGL